MSFRVQCKTNEFKELVQGSVWVAEYVSLFKINITFDNGNCIEYPVLRFTILDMSDYTKDRLSNFDFKVQSVESNFMDYPYMQSRIKIDISVFGDYDNLYGIISNIHRTGKVLSECSYYSIIEGSVSIFKDGSGLFLVFDIVLSGDQLCNPKSLESILSIKQIKLIF